MITFGVVVGGLAAVFGTFGKSLQTSMGGIIALSASVSVMALAMAPIAQSGTEGAIAMGIFGAVVAGLVIVFATFGTALTAAIPAMISFGVMTLMVGAAMRLCDTFCSGVKRRYKAARRNRNTDSCSCMLCNFNYGEVLYVR